MKPWLLSIYMDDYKRPMKVRLGDLHVMIKVRDREQSLVMGLFIDHTI